MRKNNQISRNFEIAKTALGETMKMKLGELKYETFSSIYMKLLTLK